MGKIITHKDAMLKHVQEGITAVADIVGRTLGPGGLPILIERQGQAVNGEPLGPMITKDGVTVANECSSDDPLTDVVIQAVKDICRKTNKIAGDGPQPLYSKVLTPKGFVPMGDIKVGMEICGTDGTIQTVLGVFPKGEKEIYKMEFSNGRTVECCAEHLWKVASACTTPYGAVSVKTTAEMVSDHAQYGTAGYVRHRYYTPKCSVEFYSNAGDMPLDPYLVGILLGDGSLSGTGNIELSLGIKKEHIIEKLRLPEGFRLQTSYSPDRHAYRVKILGKDTDGYSMQQIVGFTGLLGTHSNDKFIPKQYLYAATEHRLQLLQGLLDTDGHINARGRFEFSSISLQLVNDFIELCRSLGKDVYYHKLERKAGASYSMTPIYRVTELKGDKLGIRLNKITATGIKTPMQCIKVSNPDNLYITDDYIVTHNTTSAVVLGRAILDGALVAMDHGENPQEVRKSIEAATERVIEMLAKETTPCRDNAKIESVATISANGDREIGKIIGDAFRAVGSEGVITVDEGSSREHTLEIVDGYQFNRGAEAHDRFFNNAEMTKYEAENCHVVLYDGKLTTPQQVMPVLTVLWERYKTKMPPVLFVANEYSIDSLQIMLINKVENSVSICAVKSPHQTKVTTAMLDDLAVFLGGERLGNGGRNLANIEFDDIGICDRVMVDKYATTFFGGHGEEEAVLARVDQLKAQRAVAESPYDAGVISDRIAALAEGVAKIGVGGSTDLEVKEKYHRIEDAVNAARAAIAEGVIPGGGSTLFRIAEALILSVEDGSATVGEAIIAEALYAPIDQILDNLGVDGVVAKVFDAIIEPGKVYDGVTGRIVDAQISGILDPVKVTKTALRNACSIAALLSTCGGSIVFTKDRG